MSRRSRRGVPADVVAHQPVFFDDSLDLSSAPELVESPRSVPLLSDSPQSPLWRRLPGVYLGSSRNLSRGRGPAYVGPARGRRLAVARPVLRPPLVSRLSRAIARRANVVPSRVPVAFARRNDMCVKRSTRRSVLFALRKRGSINQRSPGTGGTYRRTMDSHLRC